MARNFTCDFCLGIQGICTECNGCFGEHCTCDPCAHGKVRADECVFCGRGFEPLIDAMTQADKLETDLNWLRGPE